MSALNLDPTELPLWRDVTFGGMINYMLGKKKLRLLVAKGTVLTAGVGLGLR